MTWTLEERLRRVLRGNHKRWRHVRRVAMQARLKLLREDIDKAEARVRYLRLWHRRMQRALENGEYE